MMRRAWITYAILILQTKLICACAGQVTSIQHRVDNAQEIATNAELKRLDFHTSHFTLASWQRLNSKDEEINIYIEGDGLAWLDKRTPSLNPTPKNPIGLKLSANDPWTNIIYIARPCQFVSFNSHERKCDDIYWRGKRFAPEVIQAYQEVLDEISLSQNQKHGIKTKFNLIGYSGGANIAGLLASERDDINTLRTVAGNINNSYFVSFHGVTAMPYSLNMADRAQKLKTIPQYHFIGAKDDTIPPDIYKSYREKLGLNPPICANYKIVENASHIEGWDKAWPYLLSIPVQCY